MASDKTSAVPSKRAAGSSQVAFEQLRQAILTGELQEGMKVREARLAVEWGIGVTPLREAVRRLAEIGYLILQPNQAPVVRKLAGEDIRQIYALRELLECHALQNEWETIRKTDLAPLQRLAANAQKARGPGRRLQAQFTLDTELHGLWTRPTGNPWLSASLERLLIYRPNLMSVLASRPEFVEQAFVEHQAILSAIAAGSLVKTQRFLAHHIQNSGATLAALAQPLPHS